MNGLSHHVTVIATVLQTIAHGIIGKSNIWQLQSAQIFGDIIF